MFFVGGRAAFGFALASVHFRDFAAEREAEDDAQEHDDGEDDYALQVRVAYRPDYVGGHEELEAEHERLFEREAQVQPLVFCGAAAREREAQAARDRRGYAAEYDDYADEFYRRAGVFGEEVERVRRGAEDFHGALFRQQAADEDEVFRHAALRRPFYRRGEEVLRRRAYVAAERLYGVAHELRTAAGRAGFFRAFCAELAASRREA